MTAPNSNSTTLATQDEPKTLGALFQTATARQRIEPFLQGVALERVAQEVILAANANPDIKKCSGESIIFAVARAVSWGGIIGEDVHLVPYGTRLTAMMDYKFKAKLIVATGTARQVFAVAVYKNEPFRLMQGTHTIVEHQVLLDPASRGPMIGAYAVAKLRGGDAQVVSMSIEEIDRVRQNHSKQWKKGDVPDWYAQKTVIHRLAKLLPASPKMAELLKKFEQEEADELGSLVDVTPADGEAPARVHRLAVSPPNESLQPDGRTRDINKTHRAVHIGSGLHAVLEDRSPVAEADSEPMPKLDPNRASTTSTEPIYEPDGENEDQRDLNLHAQRFVD